MALPKLRNPIVLVHGLFGFNRLKLVGLTLANYWPGIVEALEAAGNRVLVPALSPTGGVANRAQQLKEFLQTHSPHEPVHIIAHSMGGLDARYMISCLGMADRVLSLTTLGTPHRGTTFANWAILRMERILKPILTFFGVPIEGFYDLTTGGCQKFNELVKDAPSVRYFSVAGKHNGSYFSPEWRLSHLHVLEYEGENDGVVSLASAQWGEGLDVWDGDHFSLVNWFHLWARNRSFFRDPTPRYAKIVQRLADLGF